MPFLLVIANRPKGSWRYRARLTMLKAKEASMSKKLLGSFWQRVFVGGRADGIGFSATFPFLDGMP